MKLNDISRCSVFILAIGFCLLAPPKTTHEDLPCGSSSCASDQGGVSLEDERDAHDKPIETE